MIESLKINEYISKISVQKNIKHLKNIIIDSRFHEKK